MCHLHQLRKKKKKKICRRNSVELDFGVNFGWDWHFVEQAPFDPAVNKDIIQSLASRPTLSCCYRDVFFGKTRASSDKGEIWKSIPSKGNSFTTYFVLNSLTLGLFSFLSVPSLNISINLLILSSSSLLKCSIWHSERSKATQMHWFASQTKPFFFFLSLLPRWQIIWVCCSQEPDFETNSKCVLWGVCVCISGCLWGSDKHMCAVVWLQKQNSYCVELIRRESSMWFFLPPYTIMTLVDFTG